MKKTAEDLKQFKMHQDYVPIKGASLYVFTLEQINELLASQSRPAVLMPGEEDLKQYITNLLYKARDNGADVLNETSFDSWQEEQESRFCQRKR